jgi:hypothetical protein
MRLSLRKTERKLHRLSDKLGSFAALTTAYCLTATTAAATPHWPLFYKKDLGYNLTLLAAYSSSRWTKQNSSLMIIALLSLLGHKLHIKVPWMVVEPHQVFPTSSARLWLG